MKKTYLSFIVLLTFSFFSCSEDFLDISPKNSITDDAVWSSGSATKMFLYDIYNSTLSGPLYNYTATNNRSFDHLFTDDMGLDFNQGWNTFNFTASNAPINRWSSCYSNIRKTNLGIEKLSASDVLTKAESDRFLGDLHFLRGLLYLELFRFYGGVPLIKQALNRNEEEIFYARNTAEETLKFIIEEFQTAGDFLPLTLIPEEYGRATRGAALGMKAVALLHGAGTVDARYYADAATAASVFITGDLQDRYELFGKSETDPLKKREAYQNLFLEPYEGNSEVIFDVQYAFPYKSQGGYQTVAAPGAPGVNNAYGWGMSAPVQNLVDAYEMKDGSAFNWNNSEHAANPYANRDERLYATVLYHGVTWKGAFLSLSSNRFDNGVEVKNNLPNGLFSTKSERTKTGYFIRKHMNESVICGPQNRQEGIGDGGNLIVLRFAEILLTYAEAKNEVSGPDASVYDAVNQIRRRAGQPDLIAGLSKEEMREKIRNERRIEMAFECKRFFDIIRWNAGEKYLNVPLMGMDAKYVKTSTGEIKLTYTPFKVVDKIFSSPKNNLLPIPLSAMNQNPKLTQNPNW